MTTRITITGPESTGKTTLAQQLALHFKADLVREVARTYLTPGASYSLNDILAIAHLQHEHILHAQRDIQIVDTDGLTTYLWAKDKFKQENRTLLHLWQSHYPDLYLLCYPDLPWEEDPLREDPDRLDELFELYHTHLKTAGVPFTIIKSLGDERTRQAIRAVQQVL